MFVLIAAAAVIVGVANMGFEQGQANPHASLASKAVGFSATGSSVAHKGSRCRPPPARKRGGLASDEKDGLKRYEGTEYSLTAERALTEESDGELTLHCRIVELESTLLELIKSADAYSYENPSRPKLLAELQDTIKRASVVVFKELDDEEPAARH